MLVYSKEQQSVKQMKSGISSVRFGLRDGIRRRTRPEDKVVRTVAELRTSDEKT